MGEKAEWDCEREADRYGGDQRDVVRHRMFRGTAGVNRRDEVKRIEQGTDHFFSPLMLAVNRQWLSDVLITEGKSQVRRFAARGCDDDQFTRYDWKPFHFVAYRWPTLSVTIWFGYPPFESTASSF